MNDDIERAKAILVEIADKYCDAAIRLEAVYPDGLQLSIENCERYMKVKRVETFEALIDFWYINGKKEFEYDVFAPWLARREKAVSE